MGGSWKSFVPFEREMVKDVDTVAALAILAEYDDFKAVLGR